ncbi:stage III sporulation protein AG [Paludicola sp. MB14-C6]|uniref:stage III sporulation protein AG n=1 Tax=Paludihabitans sp. MB14-C6 TaxID=3070656 RepID=UPI0027DC69E2|nr:stage III sporulation protein AG [Paludicola sp. MB14-C6]WMJ23026.1 stage III sporulation protein AG [Paludicola sp. MB14-C6]
MKLTNLIKGDKKIIILVVLGLIGIVLIGLTSIIPPKVKTTQTKVQEQPINDYKKKLEQEVLNLVTSIHGVGKAKVMVTLKNGVEYVYVKEEKQNTDTTNGAAGTEQTVQQRDNYEQKTIIVEDENGRKTALLRTTLEPTVKGVVIVCEGGDDVAIQQAVTDAVKTALGIGSNSVCVSKLNP